MSPGTMLVLSVPVALLLLAALLPQHKARRFGYVERIVGRWPMPGLAPRDRVEIWRILYDRCTIEQQTEPGAWPFAPTAVHTLPRELQTDPRELVR